MTTKIVTQVMTRLNDTDLLMDWTAANAGDYQNELQSLPINSNITWSNNGLTRTLIRVYDETLQPQIDAIESKYSAVLAAENARRKSIGIVISSFETTSDSTNANQP